jgi:hydroxyethylthiazole kinase-like uncharacterized protein yjeF
MRRAYHVEAIRHAEAELMARLPDGALMQRAAAGLATIAARILREAGGVYGSRVVLLVGVGDNGGDALYAGAMLAGRGVHVEAVLLDPARVHEGGLAALRQAGGRVGDAGAGGDASGAAAFEGIDLIIDGMLGIGGKGGLRGKAAELAEEAAASGVPILAVDLPSGIDADSGRLAGAVRDADSGRVAGTTSDADSGQVAGSSVRAHVTVTFGAYKPGLLIDPAAERAGVVEFVDIGLSALPPCAAVEALQAGDVAALLPRPAHDTDKYARGVAGVACGSAAYPGAGILATGAALRAGCGAVRYSGPREVADDILRRWPEVMIGEALPADTARVQAWVCGSGFPTGDGYAAQRTRQVIESGLPAVLDAGALSYVGPQGGAHAIDLPLGARIVITPHAGEAARLLGAECADIEARRLDSVRRLADTFGVTALLKGTTTLVAEPGGSSVRVNPTGTPALATAGSGDVLAGLIGGLLAAGLAPVDAASVGAYLHGLAGRIAYDVGSGGAVGGNGSGTRGAAGGAMARGVGGGGVNGDSPVVAGDLLAALTFAWHNVQS